ncbi:RNA polymerase sigma-70 factor, ECF subfamily [Nannocystis exedens]|uniref:RNA polymerase sigma-70 factor, ECF subfamily n=1 Tax=Nannocystis exedens TaxID=54 RepID=A0A1I2CT50_9BACT|nr:sigma-70 family RNA polymerase sigma factor [Nannocystis exedens]PCC68540.1 transcriptional regulator [Nannocystis exedens]SFE71491.1 RNA polymerase sigma-70 factor, ECF subfamily [Nannocystis exedens]
MRTLALQLAARTGHTLAPADVTELAAQLEAAAAATRAKWPELTIRDELWLEALAPRLDSEADLVAAFAQLAVADVYLVGACLAGDKPALAILERLTRTAATHVVARLGGRLSVEDVVQELLMKLVVGESRKLAGFGGQGALAAWLRISAVRTAISLGRKRQELALEDETLEAIADEGDDQALAFLKASYRDEFKRAFAAALAELSKRSRTLLRLQINDQLTLPEIGAFYRVSRATAARWLAEARADLLKRTRTRLMTSLGLPAEELGQLMRLVASNLYGTLPGLLRQTHGGDESGQ